MIYPNFDIFWIFGSLTFGRQRTSKKPHANELWLPFMTFGDL